MWVIGMLVCMGLMLGGGHAFMKAGHGSQSHHGADAAAGTAGTPAATPDEGAPGAAPENASQPQQERGHHH